MIRFFRAFDAREREGEEENFSDATRSKVKKFMFVMIRMSIKLFTVLQQPPLGPILVHKHDQRRDPFLELAQPDLLPLRDFLRKLLLDELRSSNELDPLRGSQEGRLVPRIYVQEELNDLLLVSS